MLWTRAAGLLLPLLPPRSSHCALNRAARAASFASHSGSIAFICSAVPNASARFFFFASRASRAASASAASDLRLPPSGFLAPAGCAPPPGCRPSAPCPSFPPFLRLSFFFALFLGAPSFRNRASRPAPLSPRSPFESFLRFASASSFDPGMGFPVLAHSRRRLSRSVNSKGIPKRSARCFRFAMSASMAATSAARSAAISSSDFLGGASSAAAGGVVLRGGGGGVVGGGLLVLRGGRLGGDLLGVGVDEIAGVVRGFVGDVLELVVLLRGRGRLLGAGEGLLEALEEHGLDAGGVQALLLARVAEFLRWDGMKWAGESGGRFGRGGRGRLESHKDAARNDRSRPRRGNWRNCRGGGMRSGRGRGKDRAGMDARWGIGSSRGAETSGVGTHLDFHLLVRGHVAHSGRRVGADLNFQPGCLSRLRGKMGESSRASTGVTTGGVRRVVASR